MHPPKAVSTYRFDAIGTKWQIDTTRPLEQSLKNAILQMAERYDNEFSRFKEDSLVSLLEQNGGSAEFSQGVPELFGMYDSLYELTDGFVSPLVGGILSDLGYDRDYSLKLRTVHAAPSYDILSHIGQTVSLTEPALIDIGAAGKGYLVDHIANLIAMEHDLFTIDGSGDIYTHGNTQRIGLEHPEDTALAIGYIDLEDGALCASASNRRAWGDGLHHVVNPKTGEPVRDIVATWVIADTTLVADGLATALFFTDPAVLYSAFDFSYIVLNSDGSVSYSKDTRIHLYD